jgi:hypothetical protein
VCPTEIHGLDLTKCAGRKVRLATVVHSLPSSPDYALRERRGAAVADQPPSTASDTPFT